MEALTSKSKIANRKWLRARFALAKVRLFRRNAVTTTGSMDLGDILSPQQIKADLQATNRWEAIDELIGNLVESQKIKPEHREAIVAVVKKRESSMSTGIGFGIGIPHASTDLIQRVVGAFGRSKKGINFDALDNQPVTLVMLFLVPQGEFQKHLHTLAKIAKLLHKKEFRQALEVAPDADAMYQIIKNESGK
jgi:mannitol/fructose-specific phosphotransferase system IIA component (Ntr-type)